MKDSMDSTAVGRALDPEVFANRKLIRPALNRNDHPRQERRPPRAQRPPRAPTNGTARRRHRPSRPTPRISTTRSRCRPRRPMVLVLQDGEEIHGVIEWYDKYCLKVNRNGASNLLIYKPSIKYMYKESEAGQRR